MVHHVAKGRLNSGRAFVLRISDSALTNKIAAKDCTPDVVIVWYMRKPALFSIHHTTDLEVSEGCVVKKVTDLDVVMLAVLALCF